MIETKHAALDTLAVTIQALHVSGKQMTLAVFRQLPCIKGIRDNPDSEHWGIVRYAIKDEGDIWLVLSLNGVLHREPLNPGVNRILKERVIYYQGVISRNGLGTHALYEAKDELPAALAALENEERRAALDKCLVDSLPQLFIAV